MNKILSTNNQPSCGSRIPWWALRQRIRAGVESIVNFPTFAAESIERAATSNNIWVLAAIALLTSLVIRTTGVNQWFVDNIARPVLVSPWNIEDRLPPVRAFIHWKNKVDAECRENFSPDIRAENNPIQSRPVDPNDPLHVIMEQLSGKNNKRLNDLSK